MPAPTPPKGQHRHPRRTPPWWRKPRPRSFQDNALTQPAGCAFCEALNRACSADELVIDLDELERLHGECVCLP